MMRLSTLYWRSTDGVWDPGEPGEIITWGAWGQLVDDVLPAIEESKGAFSKKWHQAKAHLKGTTDFKN